MIPAAWQLATYGIGSVVFFAAWKLTVSPRLVKLAIESSS